MGTTHVDGKITLNSTKLVFQDNQNNKRSTWGPNTSIDTTLSAAKILGSIDIKTPIDIVDHRSIKVVVIMKLWELSYLLTMYQRSMNL